jgi:rubrerythrin
MRIEFDDGTLLLRDAPENVPHAEWDDRVDVALWECRYCPVHLLINHTGAGETAPILFGEAPAPEWGLDYLFANPRRCGHRSHRDQADWYDCPSCRQLNP